MAQLTTKSAAAKPQPAAKAETLKMKLEVRSGKRVKKK